VVVLLYIVETQETLLVSVDNKSVTFLRRMRAERAGEVVEPEDGESASEEDAAAAINRGRANLASLSVRVGSSGAS
jgi:hypothetical protein